MKIVSKTAEVAMVYRNIIRMALRRRDLLGALFVNHATDILIYLCFGMDCVSYRRLPDTLRQPMMDYLREKNRRKLEDGLRLTKSIDPRTTRRDLTETVREMRGDLGFEGQDEMLVLGVYTMGDEVVAVLGRMRSTAQAGKSWLQINFLHTSQQALHKLQEELAARLRSSIH